MNNTSSSLEEAKKYRYDLAKKLNNQRLLTSNKITNLLVKKLPESILDEENKKPEYIEAKKLVMEKRKLDKEENKINWIIDQIKSQDDFKKIDVIIANLNEQDKRKIKEYFNKNKIWLIDKYIKYYLPIHPEVIEGGRDDYFTGEIWSRKKHAIMELRYWWYIDFNMDTAKSLIDGWYSNILISNFAWFDKEWQEYLIWYYMKNKKKYARLLIDDNLLKIDILETIYDLNAEYGHNSNYQKILKDLLSDEISILIANEITEIIDGWVARKWRNIGQTHDMRPNIRNLASEIKNENYKWVGHLKTRHLIKWEKIIECLEKNWAFDKMATISSVQSEETKNQIIHSFN